MATSPDRVRLGTSATSPLGEIAIDAAREAVIIIDMAQQRLPFVLANAAARRSLLGRSEDRALLDASLYSFLELATESVIDSVIASGDSELSSVTRVLPWRLSLGRRSIATEIKRLAAPGQRLMMLTFAEPSAETGLLSVIEQLPLDLLILDKDLTVTYANPGAARSAGSVAGEILSYSALSLVPTSVVPREVYDRALKGHHYYDDAVAVTMPGAETRWFEVDVQPLKEASQIIGLSVLSMEVTARHSRRRAPSGSDRRLFALTEHAHDIITVAGGDGRLQYVSGGVRNSLGYTAEERHAHSIFQLLHPDDVDALRSQYLRLVAGDIEAFTTQYRLRHKNGSYRWFESNYVSALDNPLVSGIVINSRDITDSRLAEDRLAQREEVFQLAADSVDGVIYEWDIASGAAQRSRGVRDVLGIMPGEIAPVAHAWSERIHPQDVDAYNREIANALKTGRGWSATYRIRDGRNLYRSFFERSLIQRDANGVALRAVGCCVDVSEIKRLTDLLAETQHAAKIGGWEYSYVTHELAWTDETYRIFETTPEEFPLSWDAMLCRFTPESRQGFLDACAAAESNGDLDLELEIVSLDQQRLWVRILGHVESQDSKPVRSFGSVQNIQAQKQAQVALETSSGWLKLSMNMAHMHAWRWARDGDTLEFAVIEGAARHLPRVFPGMKRLIGRIHPKDRLAVRRAIDQAFENHAEGRAEFRLRGSRGQYRWYAAIARPRFDAANQPSGLVGVVQDVTARHAAEQRLRRSEELLRATTANTSDTLLLLDDDLVVQFINRNAYGVPIDAIIGRNISVLLPDHRRRQVIERLHHVLQTGEDITYEFDRMFDGAATQYYECRAVLVSDNEVGTGISMTVRNITQRKRMEQEILDVASRERHTIGRDLHDGLGQELTGVALMLRGLAKRIERQCPDSIEQINEIVQSVNQSIETARALARGLLPLQTERGGLSDALRELAARGRALYGFEITLRTELEPGVLVSEAQASHLYRIAQEALTNAARHAGASSVAIALSVSTQRTSLEIIDDGIGIALSGRAASGMGLKIMKYRASIIGANCEILPNQPHGTVIRVTGEQPAALPESQPARSI